VAQINLEQETEKESEQKESKGDKESSSGESSGHWSDPIKNFFFEPNGGPPKPESWGIALAAAAGLFFIVNYRAPIPEIIMTDFMTNYLQANKVKEIRISKDRRSEVFNHRAEIETVDGEKFYMILGNQESFLAKLDMV
jgi:hypothetical protein